MSYNDPKVGEVISKWDMTEPYKCTESGPSEPGKESVSSVGRDDKQGMESPGNANIGRVVHEHEPNGDNPNLSFDASLPVEGDTRVKGPSPSSNPVPGKVGA